MQQQFALPWDHVVILEFMEPIDLIMNGRATIKQIGKRKTKIVSKRKFLKERFN